MAMKIRTVSYCVKQGAVNLYKNRLMSLASIGTISACILVIGVFYSIVANVEFTITSLQNNVGIEIFFDKGVSEQRILTIKTELEGDPRVFSTTYTSAEAAWESFKKSYFEGREELLSGFENENPLKESASLRVFLADIDQQEQLVTEIKKITDVRYIREEQEVTNVIRSFSDLIKYISIVLIAVLIMVSMFLISNTVRLAIELRKVEINIMKYIGATDPFIRGPFIIEGAAIGLSGVIAPLIVIYFMYNQVIHGIMQKFLPLEGYLTFLTIPEIFMKLVPLSIVIGAGIGVFGSILTIHRHLRV